MGIGCHCLSHFFLVVVAVVPLSHPFSIMSAAAVATNGTTTATMNGSSTMSPDPKIIDLLNNPPPNGTPYISLEYFPPKTEEGVMVRVTKRVRSFY